MGIFLSCCPAFERGANGLGGREQSRVDNIGCRPVTAVARIDELDRAGRCGKADQGQLEQSSGILHLGFFKPEAVAFQRTKISSILHLSR